jgi:hypothetical protein
MARTVADDRVRGKTLRWAFTEGPTKGAIFDHTFHEDGTVEWHTAENAHAAKGAPARVKAGEGQDTERAKYAAIEVAQDVLLVSYLAASGYTLTVALNFDDGRLRGFASNEKEWYPVAGTFEALTETGAKRAA